MKAEEIGKISRRYARQELLLTVAVFLIVLSVARVCYMDNLIVPAIVSAVFSLVLSATEAWMWGRVAKRSPESLTTFYSAASGFRLLFALATMFVYYLVVGRDAMLVFFIVFMIFYVILLLHTSVFFARVSSRSREDEQM
ncbi:MAG: hypothetical protein IJM81_00955 [Prevotella sp.]|nr:hypothetical protein [Prevotella sp.]